MSERTLGDFLEQERRKRNLTLEKIAQELRVSVMTVHRWKSGERFPQEHYWSALIAFCGSGIWPCLAEGGRARHEAYTAKRQRAKEATSSAQNDASVEIVSEVVSSAQSDFSDEPVDSPTVEPEFIEYVIPLIKMYRGWRQKEWDETYQVYTEKVYVTVDGHPLPYFNTNGPFFPPEGPSGKWCEWGYSGTGPRELATAILADYFGEKSPQGWAGREEYQAVRYCHDFKDDFVQWFPKQSWEITSEEIEAWLKDFKEREKTRAAGEEGWYWDDKGRWQKGWERHQRWRRKQLRDL